MLDQSIALAAQLQKSLEAAMSSEEKRFHEKMEKLLRDPKNKVMLIELLDRCFRTSDARRSHEEISFILAKYGISDFFSTSEKLLLRCFLSLGKMAPKLSVPFFVDYLRKDTAAMVLDDNEAKLDAHIIKRKAEKITLNVNLIGEEVLGEGEAAHRIANYEKALRSEHIEYISIKITTIFSQINIIDYEYSKAEVVKRLDHLYALAAEQKQKGKPKFINLDMEEFRDLELTVDAFMESLSKYDIHAGIVLQAYLPDSYEYLEKLIAFSKERVLAGKEPIKIRFVKGANMESEETIASLRGWTLPTFTKKIDTDSNYKKMLELVLSDENFKYIKVGIASHNLFELAHAITCVEAAGAHESFSYEMLEGMSLACSHEVAKARNLILYAPVCGKESFSNAIAYLVRRLDENTADDNFMRHFFNMKLGDKKWQEQEQLFKASLQQLGNFPQKSKRVQNRLSESFSAKTARFSNESDTDFIMPANREWAQKIKAKYNAADFMAKSAPVVAGLECDDECPEMEVKSKEGKLIGKSVLASKALAKTAVEAAKKSTWNKTSLDERIAIFAKVAEKLREKRGDLIGIAALEVGKTFLETDPEISEAIDFVEYYASSLKNFAQEYKNTSFAPRGIAAVISPWNFPVGIPAGTIAGPLMSGNVVIFKPSSLATLTAAALCEVFYEAGLPRDALIYLPCSGEVMSECVIKDSAIDFCVFTGGEESAAKLLQARPNLILHAETGGKNATIVTKMADRDAAIKNVLHSAFSNSGQKCSATSLLILEDEVYEDENFKKTLKDAAASLAVGSPFDFKNKIGYLADKPSEKLKQAINKLEPHEEWLLKPSFVDNNEYAMTPGIKYGTKEGDFTHKTELFAPLLSVMRASSLDAAIDMVNATGYGLTGALESLDEREWEQYLSKIKVGNCYINKPSTGAIVLRQPFGGRGKSAIGFGRKAGFCNYLTSFVSLSESGADTMLRESGFSKELEELKNKNADKASALSVAKNMALSYSYHANDEFASRKDYVKLRGEDNFVVYDAVSSYAYRVSEADSVEDIYGVLLATNLLGIKLRLSYGEKTPDLAFVLNNLGSLKAEIHEESKASFANSLSFYERVRYTASGIDEIHEAAAALCKVVNCYKPLQNGRFELLYYLEEQSQSICYHRYGNLGSRVLR